MGAYAASLVDAFEMAGVDPETLPTERTPVPEAALGLGERVVAILRLFAAGRPKKGIAIDLDLSLSTVKWYLKGKGLFDKLNVNGCAQAVGRAKDLGLL